MQDKQPKFRDMLEKRVYNFSLDVITFIDHLPKGQVANVIGDQLLRSATSIGANVIELKVPLQEKTMLISSHLH
jgi:four helix bundle protein